MPRLILAVFLTAGFVFGFIPSTTAQDAEAATENTQAAENAAETPSPETEPETEAASPEEARLVIEDFHAGLLDILKRSEQLGHEGRAEELYPIVKQAINVR
ncbi:MAG: hypothetical protein R3360_00565, partial [Alphaproteobacteria bacterium]|nr:hypothetical protein [Alphaproteobacteria bacterium]